jgi:hypothetical protein
MICLDKKQMVMKKLLWLVDIIFLVTISTGCAWFQPYYATPIEALTEFPGYLTETKTALVDVLAQEKVAGGIVLLYKFPAPSHEASGYCIATTFVTQKDGGSWRAQSGSRLGCGVNYLEMGDFVAAYTVGGNVTELTTVYGVGQGHQVRIEWSDGQESTVFLANGVFLQSRPDTLQVERVELLNEVGEILAAQTWKQQP